MADHYFSAEPASADERTTMTVELADREVVVHTAPGVFSAGRLDLGTRVLLREVPDPPGSGHVLDLGCGWGPIALTLALQAPGATVWAVDVNRRALDLVRRTTDSLGLTNVVACEPDQVPDDVSFGALWSNPPIRVGKAELHAMLLRWLARLTPDGEAWLVVQRSLGSDSLADWLRERGVATTRAASAKGYRVLRGGPAARSLASAQRETVSASCQPTPTGASPAGRSTTATTTFVPVPDTFSHLLPYEWSSTRSGASAASVASPRSSVVPSSRSAVQYSPAWG